MCMVESVLLVVLFFVTVGMEKLDLRKDKWIDLSGWQCGLTLEEEEENIKALQRENFYLKVRVYELENSKLLEEVTDEMEQEIKELKEFLRRQTNLNRSIASPKPSQNQKPSRLASHRCIPSDSSRDSSLSEERGSPEPPQCNQESYHGLSLFHTSLITSTPIVKNQRLEKGFSLKKEVPSANEESCTSGSADESVSKERLEKEFSQEKELPSANKESCTSGAADESVSKEKLEEGFSQDKEVPSANKESSMSGAADESVSKERLENKFSHKEKERGHGPSLSKIFTASISVVKKESVIGMMLNAMLLFLMVIVVLGLLFEIVVLYEAVENGESNCPHSMLTIIFTSFKSYFNHVKLKVSI